MTTWAVVPMKCFRRAKSRLAPALSPEEREALARRLFDRVLEAVAPQVEGVLVLTDGPDVAEAARGHRVLWDAPGLDLGALVNRGLGQLRAERGLVVMADLPEIVPEDVRQLLRHGHAVAPDLRDAGTNALVVPLPGRACFGHADSFRRHLAAGPAVVRRRGLALDLDRPEDLRPGAPPGSRPSPRRSA